MITCQYARHCERNGAISGLYFPLLTSSPLFVCLISIDHGPDHIAASSCLMLMSHLRKGDGGGDEENKIELSLDAFLGEDGNKEYKKPAIKVFIPPIAIVIIFAQSHPLNRTFIFFHPLCSSTPVFSLGTAG